MLAGEGKGAEEAISRSITKRVSERGRDNIASLHFVRYNFLCMVMVRSFLPKN